MKRLGKCTVRSTIQTSSNYEKDISASLFLLKRLSLFASMQDRTFHTHYELLNYIVYKILPHIINLLLPPFLLQYSRQHTAIQEWEFMFSRKSRVNSSIDIYRQKSRDLHSGHGWKIFWQKKGSQQRRERGSADQTLRTTVAPRKKCLVKYNLYICITVSNPSDIALQFSKRVMSPEN